MNKNLLKNMGAALVLVMLFSVAFVFLPTPSVKATMTISLSPMSGVVGDTIVLNGTIDTENGNFTLRWDQTNITKGKASGYNVNVSFVVPPTVGLPSGRNVTIDLIDDTIPSNIISTNFTLYTKFDMQVATLPPPKQLLEGSSTEIVVNVTGGEPNTVYTANITVKNPANQVHSAVAFISNTTTLGSGSGVKVYPNDFSNAHTNYTGKYLVSANVTNLAIVVREFFIGLTDKLEYRRNETVQIRAAGYKAAEVVKVDIKTGASSVATFPKNWTADSSRMVVLTWKIPFNATSGTYSVTVTNTTDGGTVKLIEDAQTFDVLGVACNIQTTNLASEAVESALVEVYNATAPSLLLLKGYTNATGWIRFNLDSGNYSFRAFFLNVEVGNRLNESVTMDKTFILKLRLVNIVMTVETEAGERVPFADIDLNYNFTERDNKSVSAKVARRTNLTGMAEADNLFTNTTYVVEAKRYDALFNSTTLTIELLPTSPLGLHLTLPTFTLNVHALDSKSLNASRIQIKVYEWAAGVTTPLQTLETNSSGDTSFLLPFGKYNLRAYKDNVFLDETHVNLIKNPMAFTLYLVTVNVDVTVSILDYFGQPIANAEVKIERKINQEYVLAYSQLTGASGSAVFNSMVGGDSRISVYVAGRLTAVKTGFLGADSNQASFRIGEYVIVFGFPLETGLFAFCSFILVLAAVFLVLIRGQLTKAIWKKRRT